MKNLFISVEGGDGSGKSTQLNNIIKYLESRGMEFVFTREPGGTAIGEKIRDIILDPANEEMAAITEAMLYAASRAQHVEELIKPSLAKGLTVVCDRFVDSSYAYQGYARGLKQAVYDINAYAISGCKPDLTIFLDVSPDEAMSRISQRGHDRLEKEDASFHNKVYEGYQYLIREDFESGENRIISIKAGREPDEVWKDIERALDERFGQIT